MHYRILVLLFPLSLLAGCSGAGWSPERDSPAPWGATYPERQAIRDQAASSYYERTR